MGPAGPDLLPARRGRPAVLAVLIVLRRRRLDPAVARRIWPVDRIRDAAVATFVACGPAPGASPATVAIVTATMQAHGALPRSHLAAPLAGALLGDIASTDVRKGFVLPAGSRTTRGAYAPRNTRAPHGRFPS